MLFNSQVFIFLFLPVVLLGFFLLARASGPRSARIWLLAASLVFYGWWSVPFLGLLIGWIVTNYFIGQQIIKVRRERGAATSRLWAAGGIAANLAGLGYFKYATFLTGTVTALTGIDFAIGAVILPLAISFHTFQQIAYIADLQSGHDPKYTLFEYMLFVSFFPQLIAGPIVHHYELLPQMKDDRTFGFQPDRFAEGVAFFVIGLVKKLALADPLSSLATPVFATATASPPGFGEAWLAVTAFGLGLYFDFSAYSDMAIGLARMFGIRLPYNFNSPYKANSIIDFWRRWHMTLSRFLRDYLYIPLGGNRRGGTRRSVNLFITMLLGGLWHGAAWTFVVWGGLHGAYLLVNHAWNGFCERQAKAGRAIELGVVPSRILTLIAVMIAWCFFAAPSFGSAMSVMGGMFGFNGLIGPEAADALAQSILVAGPLGVLRSGGLTELVNQVFQLLPYLLAVFTVFCLPNSQEIIDRQNSATDTSPVTTRLRFTPGIATGVAAAAAFIFALSLMSDVKEFVYFQF
ncbi:MBOAT family O-acyltransferase [Hyphomonas sp.]|uniref:MBOAT family O-acyltransferase n=1 Tax=Hyphomonas sp. TaxID=87 RepID=UPI00391CFAAF